MDRIMVAAAIGMGLVFVTGVMVGIVLMMAMAIRRRTGARRSPRSLRVPARVPSGS